MNSSQDMFEIKKTKISGCLELIPNIFDDKRGLFVKVFHQNAFASAGLETNFTEEYYSKSIKGVIRGLHFQIPPKDHVKVCYCVQGSVFDVVLDLRLGSPTFGEHEVFSLTAKDANMVYIPKGMAHGFCSLSESSILVYKTSTVYDANYDSGIRWDSAGIQWPTESPIMSDRDKEFIDFQSFKSPFGPALL